jgi:integrase
MKAKFGSPLKAVTTWAADEFERAVDAAPGKLKLALLLMANCGMTQKDVADLRDDEVDWQAGRITRRRSKTANRENAPVVSYKLWPVTLSLLKKYRSGKERVLLTEQGQPFVRTRFNAAGKQVKADGIASNFVHLKKRLKLKRPLKELRRLGATLLAKHKEYGRFSSFFLGHSPRTVADRHYVAPSQDRLDEAILWLGKQLGQVKGK